jgi:hypothetical protein
LKILKARVFLSRPWQLCAPVTGQVLQLVLSPVAPPASLEQQLSDPGRRPSTNNQENKITD